MNILEIKKLVAVSDTKFLRTFNKELLLKFLIEQLDSTQTVSSPISDTVFEVDKVIFESDIDGEHYCVVRCRPSIKNEAATSQTSHKDLTQRPQTLPKKHLPEKISLSPREKAIAKLVAQGLPNKSIGLLLQISPWTVATHLRRIFGKLGVSSRTAMIARILEEDLLHE